MPELLVELLSEEIPARMQPRAADDLKRLVTDGLGKAGLDFGTAEAFATPRRLALAVAGLPVKQPDANEERKGPRIGSPDKAIEGFLRSVGLDSVDQCDVREIKGAEFYFATRQVTGQFTRDALVGILHEAVDALSWPKSMRWGRAERRWVRPLHNLLAVFDGAPLDFRIDLGAEDDGFLAANGRSAGHRFLAPEPVEATTASDYRERLEAAFVLVEPARRRAEIEGRSRALAEAAGLRLRDDPGLLDEVTGLVEWPVPLLGEIDAAFMELPPEVLTTSMRTHQKYFALEDEAGRLAPRFVVVANIETADGGKAIVAGNERVLRARLSDAKFFWDQDRSRSLGSRAPALKEITWHAKLGTMDEKVDRMQSLAIDVTAFVPGADRDRVRAAARLAKADLVTGMVGEFPELQGLMGRYYALHDGEHEQVADAVAEHYAPAGPTDACPTKPVSVCVALADKVDSLVGFWGIGEKPTGSRDPYAIRRAALGVIRLILENGLRAPLLGLFERADILYREMDPRRDWSLDSADLLGFFADRLKVHLREQGVRHDHIAAVFELGGEDDLVRLLARVSALSAFLDSPDGANLLAAYRRAANIVRIEEKKDGATHDGAVDEAKLVEPEETALARALAEARGRLPGLMEAEDFEGAMRALAALRGPVDAFFEAVKVNADDPELRANRLRLLSQIRATMDRVADFSKIEGQSA